MLADFDLYNPRDRKPPYLLTNFCGEFGKPGWSGIFLAGQRVIFSEVN